MAMIFSLHEIRSFERCDIRNIISNFVITSSQCDSICKSIILRKIRRRVYHEQNLINLIIYNASGLETKLYKGDWMGREFRR